MDSMTRLAADVSAVGGGPLQPSDLVRRSAEFVVGQASHVSIDNVALFALAADIAQDVREKHAALIRDDGVLAGLYMDWGTSKDVHLAQLQESDDEAADSPDIESRALYAMVLSALNFCFWPIVDFEYNTLATRLKETFAAFADHPEESPFHPSRLPNMTEELLRETVFREAGVDNPDCLLDERVRLLQEVGVALTRHFGGRASRFVLSAGHSAQTLIALTTKHLPGFRDHCVYGGRQCFFYKRAQILCADLSGVFKGRSLGLFDDPDSLTMFPDYRVPQYFRERGALVYVPTLASRVDQKEVIPSGSAEEAEIRAASIVCVERLVGRLRNAHQVDCTAQEVDWWLWETAEKIKDDIAPEHRTLTIYY